jgi:hypothetical protein
MTFRFLQSNKCIYSFLAKGGINPPKTGEKLTDEELKIMLKDGSK